MPYQWEFARKERLFVARFRGRVDGEELVGCYWRAAEVVKALDPTSAVTDLIGVDALDVPSDAVQMLANESSYFPESVRTFIVAPHDLPFGLARMFQMLGDATRRQLEVVRSWRDVHARLVLRAAPEYERISLPDGPPPPKGPAKRRPS